jgi:soluble lytic murein transglycosylase
MRRTPRPAGMAGLLLATALALPALAAPVPSARPDDRPAAAPAVASPADVTAALPRPAGAALDALKSALDALDDGDVADALSLAAPLSDVERDIVTWMAIRRGADGLTPRQITDFAMKHPHWPTARLMRQRAEQALARADLPADELVKAYEGSPPISDTGMFSLVKAYAELGRRDDAGRLLAKWWAEEALSPQEDQAILKRYGDLLTPSHHKARFDMLLARDRITQANALVPQVGADYAALVSARAAVLRGARDAGKKLAAVPKALQADPVYLYTLAEWHRRGDRMKEAAEALLKIPADAPDSDGDEWWVERRIVSRDLVENGEAKLAYEVVAGHRGGDPETLQEAYFHAGWYALRFMNDPARAIPHFEKLQSVSSKPISRARSAYWLGRAEEAAGRVDAARRHYEIAASDEIAFYGQLARVKLGAPDLGLPELPEPTEADRAAFAENDLARALVLLIEAGRESETALIYPELARQLPSAGQLTLLSEFVERRGNHRLVLQIGKIAADRGLGVEKLAFPLESIPESARKLTSVETAMVYAIARQESAFDPGAVSKAGARGLLQLMPATAAATARKIGVRVTPAALTSDPGLNAQLGAAHLKELVEDFGGSYILTFAAYNAGPRKAQEWVRRFGDPRHPGVDPIDWIELIPYGETRNYVQRVTENLQVYRERLEGPKLGIAEDLRRGS